MLIKIEGHADMRKYTAHLPSDGVMEIPEGITVAMVLKMLNVPSELNKIVIVNGRHSAYDYILEPGDTLVFFPPLEGG
jgi:molybdopterin converting factor small subunit